MLPAWPPEGTVEPVWPAASPEVYPYWLLEFGVVELGVVVSWATTQVAASSNTDSSVVFAFILIILPSPNKS